MSHLSVKALNGSKQNNENTHESRDNKTLHTEEVARNATKITASA